MPRAWLFGQQPRRQAHVLRAVAVLVGVLLVLAVALTGPADAQPAPPPPTTSPGPAAPPDEDASGGAFLDPFGWLEQRLFGQVHEVINSWFRNAVTNVVNPVMELLGHSLLATPDLTAPGGAAERLWWTSLGLANTAYVLLILIGGVIVMTHETVQSRYALKDIAPRLILGLIAANSSLLLAGWAIELANAVSGGFLGQDLEPPEIQVTRVLTELVLATLTGTAPIFLGLLAAVVVVLGLALIATAIVRVVLTTMLIVVAPLALACHALPQTDGVARLWWRALAAVLGVQVAQAVTLVAAVQVFLDSDPPLSVFGLPQTDLLGLMVCAVLLWVLLRIPVWATRAVFSPRPSVIVRLAKTVVLSRALGALRRP